MHVKTLILGGGIAGLSTAYHLEQQGQTDYLVVEKESQPGGLCRSIYRDGFTFDYSGHLLHLHSPYGKRLIRTLLGKNLGSRKRQAWIYTQKARVPFPFQANLFALPAAEREHCVQGLLAIRKQKNKSAITNFEEWCLQSFGTGIYKTFLKPYNTKLWGCPPKQLTSEWCGPFVPVPNVREIRQSAMQKPHKTFGYNARFYYPQKGGSQALVEALAASVTHLRTKCPVTQIDLFRKTVHAGGKRISFDTLVNTLPLPLFLKFLRGIPALKNQKDKLSWQSVTVYQAAYQGKRAPFSWIYCPDCEDLFYRVGMQSSFSSFNAPHGCFSLYIELPGKMRPSKALEKKIEKSLLQKGILNPQNKKLFSFFNFIPYAYVRYDKNRSCVIESVLKELERHNCFCAGRYGRWEYSFIEKALLQGQALAQKLV